MFDFVDVSRQMEAVTLTSKVKSRRIVRLLDRWLETDQSRHKICWPERDMIKPITQTQYEYIL